LYGVIEEKMADQIGDYLWKDSENRTLEEVREYWTTNVNSVQFYSGDPVDIGTTQFFDEVSKFIRRNYAHRYRLIDSESEKYPGKSVLEIGCGGGWELVAWAENGMRATGLDLSSAALRLAHKNLQHNKLKANLLQGNAEVLPFPSKTFDIVASLGVLHQTTSTEKAVSEVHRILKVGGEAVVTLYYKYSWKILLAKLGKLNFEFVHEDAPITRLYTKEDMYTLFHEFDEVRVFLDYIKATKSPRKGFFGSMYNYIFRPLYNLLPRFIRSHFGHAIVVLGRRF
jgi:ubiquinone/menaquinone biosynthesis C-methylase UbiE